MDKQTYKNHVRYYIPHHVVFYSIILAGTIASVCYYFKQRDLIWLFMTAMFGIVGWLSFMMRQHYSLTLQNRIARQELRFRYYVLTGQRFDLFEEKLSLGQILALRFASDEELPAMAKRALSENLSPDSIKRAIMLWQGDYMRV